MAQTILSRNQNKVLSAVSRDRKICRFFYLSGGTALAEFYLKHRFSEDLDFFSENEFDAQAISVFFKKNKIKLGIKKIDFTVKKIGYCFGRKKFNLKTDQKNYYTDYLIVASGTKPKLLYKNPPQQIKPYLFYEAFPLLKKRNNKIVIIGAGDISFDYALSLSKNNQVIICNKTENINASSFLMREVKRNKSISYYLLAFNAKTGSETWRSHKLQVSKKANTLFLEAANDIVAVSSFDGSGLHVYGRSN